MSHSTFLHSSMVNPANLNKPGKEQQQIADHITFDVPLLLRVFELVREEVKSDADLHFVMEKIISMQNQGILTMDDYEEIAAANKRSDEPEEHPADVELESILKLAGI